MKDKIVDSLKIAQPIKVKIIEAEIKNDYVARAICFSVAGLKGLHYTFDKTSIYEIDSLSEKLFNQYELDDKESTRAEFMKNSKRAWV